MTARQIPVVLQPADVVALMLTHPMTRLLDVRSPGEHESVHIAGSYNVPLDTLTEHAQEIQSVVTSPVVLVCQSGARARQAEVALSGAGMANLHVLDGGVSGWLAAGAPVIRGPKRLSLERQVRIAAGALAATGGILALAVNPAFALLPAFVGSGLVFAGVTDSCGMAMLLSRLPYNRPATCDVNAMVRALTSGQAPRGSGREPVGARLQSCAAE